MSNQSLLKKHISAGKYARLTALADEHGIIAALAMDQRGSLQKALSSIAQREISAAELVEVKLLVTEMLTPYASAVLLDPQYGLEAAEHRAKKTGFLLAYEASGYGKGRQPSLLPQWSVRRIAEAGADAVKVVMYYDPDDEVALNSAKHAFAERAGAECEIYDIPFFLEVVSYSDRIPDEKGLDFARIKPEKVKRITREFSQDRYGVDVLKLEIPVTMRFVAGMDDQYDGPYAYDREEAQHHFLAVAAEAHVPFIYLSAGVSESVFHASLELANEARVPYSGVLCGRATWQGGLAAYVEGGKDALQTWLEKQGRQNIEALNEVLRHGAQPWWNIYGGRDQIEIVQTPAPLAVERRSEYCS